MLLFLDEVFAQTMYSARATLDAFVLHHRCLGDLYKVPFLSFFACGRDSDEGDGFAPNVVPCQHAPLPLSAWSFES